MNSRDAAYDDELLRRVIEASKEDVVVDTSDLSSRRAKRGRSDSEELVSHASQAQDTPLTGHRNGTKVKRQRTGSRSVSPPADQGDMNGGEGSDDDEGSRNGNGAKKSQNHGRNTREKSDKEDKEQQRLEAASKRKGRAERRRAEGEEGAADAADATRRGPETLTPGLAADSDLSEEMPLAATKPVRAKSAEPPSVEEAPTPAQPPGTPPTSHPTAASTQKRAARSSHKRGKGRNQHSKDREVDNDESPARSMSRDIQKNADEPNNGKPSGGDGKHGSKSKQGASHKMSMLDMKRRVAAIMEFISRTQVDLAGENGGSTTSSSGGGSGGDTPQKGGGAAGVNGEHPAASEKERGEATNGDTPEASDAQRFKELSCVEMMDVLTRDMVKWQNQYT